MHTAPLELLSDENAHMMLWRENLPAAYETLAPGGWQGIAAEPDLIRLLADAQSLSRRHDLRGELPPALARALALRSSSLAESDGSLVDALIAAAMDRLERADGREDIEASAAELPSPSGRSWSRTSEITAGGPAA